MNEYQDIKSTLENIGLVLKDCGREYRARPIYRDSNNNMSLCIYKNTGRWIDFGTNEAGNFSQLIAKILNISVSDASKYANVTFFQNEKQITGHKIFDKSDLNSLTKDNAYWNNRGISDSTLEKFVHGKCMHGSMYGRHVFVIFDENNNIIGYAGRDILNNSNLSRPKWKNIGEKTKWIFPVDYIKEAKKTKEIIIVESIGDCLSLYEAGIYNCIVSFGLKPSAKIITSLFKLDIEEIIIGLNNDVDDTGAGNDAAAKLKEKLSGYFDLNNIHINLPNKKDLNEILMDKGKEGIYEWYNNTNRTASSFSCNWL